MKKIVVLFLLFAFFLSGCSDIGAKLEEIMGAPSFPAAEGDEVFVPTEPNTETSSPTETAPPATEPEETIPATEETTPPAETAPESSEEIIAALNALLVGMQHDEYFNQRGIVSEWSDDAICHAIFSKLLWNGYDDSDSVYLKGLNLEPQYDNDSYYEFYDLDDIDAITLSCFGREYPRNNNTDLFYISNGQLYVMPVTGESESVIVQSFTQQGNMLTAVGTAVHHNNANSVFDGYFTAQFVENPESLYGYTLISYDNMAGNQSFSKLTATASSVLKESSITHYASNVLDDSLSTAWVEGASGVGINEWITLSTSDGSLLDITAIRFDVGYHKSQEHLQNNGWPTKILIEAENGYTQIAYFFTHDNVVLLDQPISTSWIKFTILEAQAGAKYSDTCISEIALFGLDV